MTNVVLPQDATLPDNVVLPGSSKFATLVLSSADASVQTKLGPIVSIPQVCRATQPGGLDQDLGDPLLTPFTPPFYGTPEWIREITYIDATASPTLSDLTAAAKWLGESRTANAQFAVGCGHISKSVTVTKLTRSGSYWSEAAVPAADANAFHSLVADGTQKDSTTPFVASEIWISDQDWDTSARRIRDVLEKIAARPLPVSLCP